MDSVEEEDDRSLTGGKASTTSIKDVSEAASEDKEEEFWRLLILGGRQLAGDRDILSPTRIILN